MNTVCSKLNGLPICSYISSLSIGEYRTDMCPENEFLQVSARKIKIGTKVQAHKHNITHKESTLTQESWIIFTGKIKTDIYDIDDSLLQSIILKAGDCVVFFRGGHSLETLEESVFYEFKNGPYFGISNDKSPILPK